MSRALQAFRISALFALLLIVAGQTPSASAFGLCSVEYCDCTGCQCQGMITCCEAVCGDCLAEINDPTSPNYLGCETR